MYMFLLCFHIFGQSHLGFENKLHQGLAMLDMTPEELMAGPKADDMSFCVDSKEFTEKTNLGRYVNGAKSREQCELINVKMCELGRVMCLGYHWISLDASGQRLLVSSSVERRERKCFTKTSISFKVILEIVITVCFTFSNLFICSTIISVHCIS